MRLRRTSGIQRGIAGLEAAGQFPTGRRGETRLVPAVREYPRDTESSPGTADVGGLVFLLRRVGAGSSAASASAWGGRRHLVPRDGGQAVQVVDYHTVAQRHFAQ